LFITIHKPREFSVKISYILAPFIFLVAFSNIVSAQAPGGGGHGGHGGGGGGGSDEMACMKARVTAYHPEHLAAVASGSEFWFHVSGGNDPDDIHVSIHEQPLRISVEDKEAFYIVKGKLPSDIKNTTIRVSVKVLTKFSKCNGEGGWLLKVGE
jgi:hypothetical protein